MLCEKCRSREATIKYMEIINGVKSEHNFCTHCAREMDLGQYTALLDGEFPLGKLLSGLLGLENQQETTAAEGRVVCPTCGMSFDDFVENSRFGCQDCYGVFDLFINDKIKQLQGSESHKGKRPSFHQQAVLEKDQEEQTGAEPVTDEEKQPQASGDYDSKKQLRDMEKQLKAALVIEDYEEAARLRDAIKLLKERAGSDEKMV